MNKYINIERQYKTKVNSCKIKKNWNIYLIYEE